MSWFKKTKSPKRVGVLIAGAFSKAFTEDTFYGLVPADSLPEGRNTDFALAEWYAFGAFTFTYCVWIVYKNREIVMPILDAFRPVVIKQLRSNHKVLEIFLNIASDRERQYVENFSAIKERAGLAAFFSLVLARITGDVSEDQTALGFPQQADIAMTMALSEYITELMTLTKDELSKYHSVR